MTSPRPEFSEDRLLDGQVRLRQPVEGYRAGMDAVLLAAALDAKPGEHLVEFGCGAGAALLCAAWRMPGVRLTGYEKNAAAADLARENVAANAMDGTVEVETLDIARIGSPHGADQVFFNPPFFDDPAALRSPKAEKRDAWLTGATPLGIWIQAARPLAQRQGAAHPDPSCRPARRHPARARAQFRFDRDQAGSAPRRPSGEARHRRGADRRTGTACPAAAPGAACGGGAFPRGRGHPARPGRGGDGGVGCRYGRRRNGNAHPSPSRGRMIGARAKRRHPYPHDCHRASRPSRRHSLACLLAEEDGQPGCGCRGGAQGGRNPAGRRCFTVARSAAGQGLARLISRAGLPSVRRKFTAAYLPPGH